jgi:hypothetical protein
MGGACLPVDSGNLGDDRLFPRRIPEGSTGMLQQKDSASKLRLFPSRHSTFSTSCALGPLERVQLDMDPNSICNTSEDYIGITPKRKHQTTRASKNFSGADSDSDSHEHVRLHKEIWQLRRPEHISPADPVLAADEVEPSPLAAITKRTLNLVHHTSAIWSQALNQLKKPRCTVKRKTQTPVASWRKTIESRHDSCKNNGNLNCRPKQKRWSDSSTNTVWGSDNIDNQPTKRPRQETDKREDQLWAR